MDTIRSYLDYLDLANYKTFFTNISITPESLFTGLALVILLLFGLSLGKTRALLSLLGIYIAYAIQAVFPYTQELHQLIFSANGFGRLTAGDIYVTRITLFIVMYFLIFIILNRSTVKSRLSMTEVSFMTILMVSILQLGLLISIFTNMLNPETLAKLPVEFTQYFSTPIALFYWFIVPIIFVLIFMRRREN